MAHVLNGFGPSGVERSTPPYVRSSSGMLGSGPACDTPVQPILPTTLSPGTDSPAGCGQSQARERDESVESGRGCGGKRRGLNQACTELYRVH